MECRTDTIAQVLLNLPLKDASPRRRHWWLTTRSGPRHGASPSCGREPADRRSVPPRSGASMQRGMQSPAGASAAPFNGGLPGTLDGMISNADLGLGPHVPVTFGPLGQGGWAVDVDIAEPRPFMSDGLTAHHPVASANTVSIAPAGREASAEQQPRPRSSRRRSARRVASQGAAKRRSAGAAGGAQATAPCPNAARPPQLTVSDDGIRKILNNSKVRMLQATEIKELLLTTEPLPERPSKSTPDWGIYRECPKQRRRARNSDRWANSGGMKGSRDLPYVKRRGVPTIIFSFSFL